MPESLSSTVSCLTREASLFTGKGSRCLKGNEEMQLKECGSEELAHNFTAASSCPAFPLSHVMMSKPLGKWVPLQLPAFILDSFIPGDAAVKGMASRRHPRFSLACFSVRDLLCSRALRIPFTTRNRPGIQVF